MVSRHACPHHSPSCRRFSITGTDLLGVGAHSLTRTKTIRFQSVTITSISHSFNSHQSIITSLNLVSRGRITPMLYQYSVHLVQVDGPRQLGAESSGSCSPSKKNHLFAVLTRRCVAFTRRPGLGAVLADLPRRL